MESILSNRVLCVLGVTIYTLIEHFQVMAFMKEAVEDGWNSDAHDFFDDLENMALVFSDGDFTAVFWTLTVCSIFFLFVFLGVYYFT
jgi:hypothetical protein